MSLKRATKEDPRGLIAESYFIDEIDEATARSIFLDWAMNDSGQDPLERIQTLYNRHGLVAPEHPMSQILLAGLKNPERSKRRGRDRN